MYTDNNEELILIKRPLPVRIFHFIVFSNLFIAGCAVAMIVQTYHLFLPGATNHDLIFFVLFSTLCSYSFHWWLTISSLLPSPRLQWLDKNRLVHLVLFFIGAIGSAIFFFRLIGYWHWLALAAIITFLYSAPKIPHPVFRALRKVALGKTIFLAFVWMYVTTLLPLLLSDQPWRTDFTLFVFHRFFLIYAICILFDYRDRADDIAAGIRSLITYLNEKGILLLFIFSTLVFVISTILLLNYGFSIPVIIVLLIPGLITALLYKKAMHHFSDLFYYFLLDGLMALSSVIMLIPVNWLNLQS